LFERFISMARSPDEPEVIRTMLRKTVEISIALTGADHGSLILLDSDGGVSESILSRGEISPEFRSALIRSAFKKGLAGWVRQHRKIGLVNDTQTDDRWLTFPEQPYRARSALALPVISGEVLLGILTLKHSKPYHFTQEIQLQPGAILFAYTDGVIDALSPGEERFTKRRLFSFLTQPVDSALELTQKIATQLFAHIGKAPQENDITMLTLQRKKSG
jgi:GAF domain-containing protein